MINLCHFVLQLQRYSDLQISICSLICKSSGYSYMLSKNHIFLLQSVYQWIIKPHSVIKTNEMFLPGRMAFIFNMVRCRKIILLHFILIVIYIFKIRMRSSPLLRNIYLLHTKWWFAMIWITKGVFGCALKSHPWPSSKLCVINMCMQIATFTIFRAFGEAQESDSQIVG